MLSIEEALSRIVVSARLVGVEDVELRHALGRLLGEDIVAPRDLSPWDNSAMDGYAVCAVDTSAATTNGVSLRLNEVIGAGGWPSVRVVPGTASAVMTGAPVPEGADAIVMIEDTDGSLSGAVRVNVPARVGQHIRKRGDDVRQGEVVLYRGNPLTAAQIGLASGLGLTTLPVSRRPVVAILSTGNEIVPPGNPLGDGQIYSSNGVALAAFVMAAGGAPREMGIVSDTLEDLERALRACRDEGVDAIVTTGGVSVGAFDFVKEAFERVGAKIDFWKVLMKPGKPLAFGSLPGRSGSISVFGLPGNPVSSMVSFLQFVRPWILSCMGAREPFLPIVEAVAAEPLRDKPGRPTFFRVQVERSPTGFLVRSTGSQSSGALKGMARGHGLVLLAPDRSGVEAGERVKVQLFDTSFLASEGPGYPW